MQLSWEDWGVLLWSGCCWQESEFECPWRIHWGRSVCELYQPHQRHKLRDLHRRLLQTWRGTRVFPCHFAVELGAQNTSSAQGAELSGRDATVYSGVLGRLTSNSDSGAIAYLSWKFIKLTLTEIGKQIVLIWRNALEVRASSLYLGLP